MRAVVVDDRADARDGRACWLRQAGLDVVGLTFLQALDPAQRWDGVDLAVLDGRDDRLATALTLTCGADGEERTIHDRFLGVRVAQTIRRTRPSTLTCIVVVSAYVRENDLMARRCREGGVDYVYELHELPDAATFVAHVLAAVGARPVASNRALRDGAGLTAAIELIEDSPSGPDVLFDVPGDATRGSPHQLRTLRVRLGSALGLHTDGGGPRTHHPSKRTLSDQMRRALGLGPQEGPDDPPPVRTRRG